MATHHQRIFILTFALLLPLSCSEIKTMEIESDTRPLILFEQFGFSDNGRTSVSISSFVFAPLSNFSLSSVGFFLLPNSLYSRASYESLHTHHYCPLTSEYAIPVLTFQDLRESVKNRTTTIVHPDEYSLYFVNCIPYSARITMQVRTEMYNIDDDGNKNYLPIGKVKLPTIYVAFFIIYSMFLGAWTYLCQKQKETTEKIHIVMGALLLFKALKLICAAEDLWHVKKTGTPHGWDVAFYVFGFFKGVLLFTVIVLVGTGWSFLKPFLQEREKKVLMVIIPLQVIENIATAVLAEGGTVMKSAASWIQLLLLIDIICCCLVFFPIIWSIKNLCEASKTDGKAAKNLEKLKLFKQFYVVVVGYLYFTRILAASLGEVISYRYWWVVTAVTESGSLAFYGFVFYNFQPVEKNPYLYIGDEEENEAGVALELMEESLDS